MERISFHISITVCNNYVDIKRSVKVGVRKNTTANGKSEKGNGSLFVTDTTSTLIMFCGVLSVSKLFNSL